MLQEHSELKSETAPARTVVVGKMAALLLQELEGSEISKLPKTIQNKLEKIFSDQQYEIDYLKAQQEQFRVDSGMIFSGIMLPSDACVLAKCFTLLIMPVNGTQLKFFCYFFERTS